MINWRHLILNRYDRRIRPSGTTQPTYYAPFLNEFYAWPIERRRQVQTERLSQLLLHAARKVPELERAIDDDIKHNNADPKPFVWTNPSTTSSSRSIAAEQR